MNYPIIDPSNDCRRSSVFRRVLDPNYTNGTGPMDVARYYRDMKAPTTISSSAPFCECIRQCLSIHLEVTRFRDLLGRSIQVCKVTWPYGWHENINSFQNECAFSLGEREKIEHVLVKGGAIRFVTSSDLIQVI